MIDFLRAWALVKIRYGGFEPSTVDATGLRRWLSQFQQRDRTYLLQLLRHVRYRDANHVASALVRQNRALLNRLKSADVPPDHVVYLQIDDAGSSSPAMLSLLRDRAGLEQLGCKLLDSRDVIGINNVTNQLETGALVFVDDFVGTGNQFCRSHDAVEVSIVGNFSKFVLAPVICEEALPKLFARSVQPETGEIHMRADRPLHQDSVLLSLEAKMRLTELCLEMHPKFGLGYEQMATMVILYRNTPNTVPLVLRGSQGQSPRSGLFPRWSDMPAPQL